MGEKEKQEKDRKHRLLFLLTAALHPLQGRTRCIGLMRQVPVHVFLQWAGVVGLPEEAC